MRRTIILIFGILVIFACKQEILFPDYDTDLPTTGAGNFPYVVSVNPYNYGQLFDDNPDTSGIQATITVTFSDFMDSTSLAGNVTVMNTTVGGEVPGIAVFYNAEARKALIRS
ncbi:MAG: hypothetical protein ACETVX_03215, partial [bacterium]